ncbi:MAG: hypothetical protein LBV30_01030 [Propionibacteriaceae bacterium]|jgi:hypothetical protein|nr:hypothetical protein [Propionibacteriaceae bacterium]
MIRPAHQLTRIGLLVCAAILTLTACSNPDADLPSLGDSTSTGPVDLVVAAKELSDCLTDLGVPHRVSADHTGALTQVSFGSMDSDALVMATWRDGYQTAGTRRGDVTAEEQAKIDEFERAPHDGATLLVDWVDKSDDFVACLDQSGYDEEAATAIDSPPPDPSELQAQLTTNNRWTACARDHGLPNLADSVLFTGEEADRMPRVILPVTTDPEVLRQVVAACPTFSPDKMEQLDDWYQEHGFYEELPADLLAFDPIVKIDPSAILDIDWCAPLTAEQQTSADQFNAVNRALYEGQDVTIDLGPDDCPQNQTG